MTGIAQCCERICDEYKAIDNRIVVVHKQNGGASSARNIGLENSRGEYIGFVDGDTPESETSKAAHTAINVIRRLTPTIREIFAISSILSRSKYSCLFCAYSLILLLIQ